MIKNYKSLLFVYTIVVFLNYSYCQGKNNALHFIENYVNDSRCDPLNSTCKDRECGLIDSEYYSAQIHEVNGVHHFEHGQWPWSVAVFRNEDRGYVYHGFGTLISDRAVVTILNPYLFKDKHDLKVYVGQYKYADMIKTTPYQVLGVYFHQQFDRGNPEHDNALAVLLLDRDVVFTKRIRSVCLPTPTTNLNGKSVYVAGWDPDLENVLQRAELTKCPKWRPFLPPKQSTCGGQVNNEGRCHLSKGSGLVFRDGNKWFLHGVFNFWMVEKGQRCSPDIHFNYMDITNSVDWSVSVQKDIYTKPELEELVRTIDKKIYNISDENCGNLELTGRPLIFGGAEITRGSWPWLVAIYKIRPGISELACGGTLVTAKSVITAAHCFIARSGYLNTTDIEVNAGLFDIENVNEMGRVKPNLKSLIIHPDYNSGTISSDSDIAVIIFAEAITFSDFIRPACIWNFDIDFTSEVGIVAGWGRYGAKETESIAKTPTRISARIVSDSACLVSSIEYRTITTNRTFCAGNQDGTGPCQGDSGGGLLVKNGQFWYLRGIVSISLSNPTFKCDVNSFVVYCDVSKYLEWLSSLLEY